MSQINIRSEHPDLLSRGAGVFRSKLITDFHLLESIREADRGVEKPMYYTSDIDGKLGMLLYIKILVTSGSDMENLMI